MGACLARTIGLELHKVGGLFGGAIWTIWWYDVWFLGCQWLQFVSTPNTLEAG